MMTKIHATGIFQALAWSYAYKMSCFLYARSWHLHHERTIDKLTVTSFFVFRCREKPFFHPVNQTFPEFGIGHGTGNDLRLFHRAVRIDAETQLYRSRCFQTGQAFLDLTRLRPYNREYFIACQTFFGHNIRKSDLLRLIFFSATSASRTSILSALILLFIVNPVPQPL